MIIFLSASSELFLAFLSPDKILIPPPPPPPHSPQDSKEITLSNDVIVSSAPPHLPVPLSACVSCLLSFCSPLEPLPRSTFIPQNCHFHVAFISFISLASFMSFLSHSPFLSLSICSSAYP